MPQAYYNLGNVLKDQGKLDEAVACYRRALELKPDFAEAHNNLGNALKDQGKLDEAVACYRRALELKPDYAEAHNNLGNALKDQGKLDEAVACYRRALELKPDYAEAHSNLGSALEEMGDLRGAEDSLPRRACGTIPGFAFAHYKLAELLGGKLPEQDLAAQRRLLEETELDRTHNDCCCTSAWPKSWTRGASMPRPPSTSIGATRCNCPSGASCGQEYDPQRARVSRHPDDRGLHAGFLRAGPRLWVGKRAPGVRRGAAAIRHDAHRADPGQPLPGLRRGRDQAGPRHHGRARRTRRRLHRGPSPVGPPDGPPSRCAALGATSRIESRGSSHRGQDAGQLLVSRSVGEPVSSGEVHSLPPRFARRGRLLLDDAFREVRWANDQQHIASRFHEYQRIMEHWRKVLPVPLLEVDYEETVADLEGVARRLVAWCGLAWEPACLEFHQAKRPVRTASAVQVRQPVFRTSVGRWKHYEQALASLFARLGVDKARG